MKTKAQLETHLNQIYSQPLYTTTNPNQHLNTHDTIALTALIAAAKTICWTLDIPLDPPLGKQDITHCFTLFSDAPPTKHRQ